MEINPLNELTEEKKVFRLGRKAIFASQNGLLTSKFALFKNILYLHNRSNDLMIAKCVCMCAIT